MARTLLLDSYLILTRSQTNRHSAHVRRAFACASLLSAATAIAACGASNSSNNPSAGGSTGTGATPSIGSSGGATSGPSSGGDGNGGSTGAASGNADAGESRGGTTSGCVMHTPGEWQLMNTVDEPSPAPSINNSDYLYWRAPALFVLRSDFAGGKYDVCLDRWQPIAAQAATGNPLVDIESGVFFGWSSSVTTRATFLFFEFTS